MKRIGKRILKSKINSKLQRSNKTQLKKHFEMFIIIKEHAYFIRV